MSEFRSAIEARDIDSVIKLLSDDVVFRSPVVHRAYRGCESAGAVIGAVAGVFEDFRYVHEFATPDGMGEALTFRARVGDKDIDGCDFVMLDDSGSVRELMVMIRPLSGLMALTDAMRSILEREG
ncbi:SnoaL-like protein [Kribbella sp. VKM Ac-2571]|uniref:nuclear transport factor 2 family protein n=1 Tax=Kribbella sp. VKM Ac-2571 TaxID=2512222 RepID=UPI0010615590|nr:nuclear transport factor 2 family protein [Kribbella sp. VKM Ac-2571]TDO56615.1 SnoaL-like protein [Kribbella sp. VKM Ac-2571]